MDHFKNRILPPFIKKKHVKKLTFTCLPAPFYLQGTQPNMRRMLPEALWDFFHSVWSRCLFVPREFLEYVMLPQGFFIHVSYIHLLGGMICHKVSKWYHIMYLGNLLLGHFGWDSITQPPFGVTSAEVVIKRSDIISSLPAAPAAQTILAMQPRFHPTNVIKQD